MRLNEINHAVLYCSKLSKLEISLEEQRERIEKFCKHLGIEIVGEYIELDNKKTQFNKMLQDIKTKKFNVIVSYSFDTLSKDNDELKKLIDEMDKYKCELHLESTYLYTPVPKYLFKIPRREFKEEKVQKKKRCRLIPIFEFNEETNPKRKESINWVEMFDEDHIRFKNNELFDEEGNYYGITRDLVVVFKEYKGCYRPMKKKQNENIKTLF